MPRGLPVDRRRRLSYCWRRTLPQVPTEKTDADASRSDVATTIGSPGDSTGGSGGAAAAAALTHLGAASHFSLQHAQNDTNTGELKSSMGSAAWTDELGGQLTWMTQQGLESGSLRVSPEHLGPVEVRISVQNGDASVWFGANHPDTRASAGTGSSQAPRDVRQPGTDPDRFRRLARIAPPAPVFRPSEHRRSVVRRQLGCQRLGRSAHEPGLVDTYA